MRHKIQVDAMKEKQNLCQSDITEEINIEKTTCQFTRDANDKPSNEVMQKNHHKMYDTRV